MPGVINALGIFSNIMTGRTSGGITMILGLSKSKYCKGIQCPKILWMDKYKPEEAEDVLPEAVLANGNKVGDVATRYFGQYDLV